jgi:ABC-2 type transport system permease protein
MWSLTLTFAKLRPFNAAMVVKTTIVAALFAGFLFGDFVLFARLFRATAQIEEATPFFAVGILRNLLSMVFLMATIVLFSSSMTVAIGSYFADLDLDLYHAAPVSKLRVLLARWVKTLLQSATIVFAFLLPIFVAFARQYGKPWTFYPTTIANLVLLLSIPVSLASLVIIVLIRFFPVRRVHQIVATIAILILTLAVVAFRMARPERFFTDVGTDDVVRVLRQIELPSMSVYPSTALAEVMTAQTGVPVPQAEMNVGQTLLSVLGDFPLKIWLPALISFLLFAVVARSIYFGAFVRARESMAPVALGAARATWLLDRLFARASPPMRAMIGKEVRTLGRDVAQWSQVFLMAALMFIYLYNIRMLPLGGDARATIVAYANLGMAGFVIAAICLRFAYPSISSEGKAFWLLQTAPVSYRQFLRVKVLVYATPLTLLALLLTAVANLMLGAGPAVWAFTLFGASLLSVTLVSLGIGMGALTPQFNAENPLQVGLSLGGFAYMALAMGYVGTMMLLMARPIMRYFFWRVFSVQDDRGWIATAVPLVTALTLSLALAVIPIVIAERRLTRLGESG